MATKYNKMADLPISNGPLFPRDMLLDSYDRVATLDLCSIQALDQTMHVCICKVCFIEVLLLLLYTDSLKIFS